MPPRAPPNSYISIYIKISCLCVCRVTSGVSTDVIVRLSCMRHEIVCRLTSCLSTDEITDRDTNDDRETGIRGI